LDRADLAERPRLASGYEVVEAQVHLGIGKRLRILAAVPDKRDDEPATGAHIFVRGLP
jgi:hypothetical protein